LPDGQTTGFDRVPPPAYYKPKYGVVYANSFHAEIRSKDIDQDGHIEKREELMNRAQNNNQQLCHKMIRAMKRQVPTLEKSMLNRNLERHVSAVKTKMGDAYPQNVLLDGTYTTIHTAQGNIDMFNQADDQNVQQYFSDAEQMQHQDLNQMQIHEMDYVVPDGDQQGHATINSMQQTRTAMKNERQMRQTTGKMNATTTRTHNNTGNFTQTNDESNVSPQSSKARQRTSQNESAFAGALTDTQRFSTQRWMPQKQSKTQAPSKTAIGWRNNGTARADG